MHSSAAPAWTPTSSRRSVGTPPAAAEPRCRRRPTRVGASSRRGEHDPGAAGEPAARVGAGLVPPARPRGRGRRRPRRRRRGQLRRRRRRPGRRPGASRAAPTPGSTGVRAPSDRTGGTLRVVSAEIDSLDPQRSYLPGVWNLMRLYTRTLVTYSTEPGHTDELVPDLATDLGTPSEDGLSWTFTLRDGRPVRERPADHLPRRQVRHRAVLRLRRHRRRPHLRRRPARRPRQPVRRARTRTRRRTSWACRRSRPPTTRRSSSSSAPRSPTCRSSWRCPPAARCRSRPTPAPATAATRSPRARTRSPRSTRRPASCSTATRSGTRPPTTSAPRCPTRSSSAPGSPGVERDQALLAGSADLDITGTGVQAATTARLAEDEDNPVRDRVDDVTTGAVRLLALPTDVAPMDNADCRAAVAAVVDRRAVQTTLGGPVNVVRTLAAVAARPARRAPRTPTRGPTSTPPGRTSRRAVSPTGSRTVLAVADTPSGVDRRRRGRRRAGRGRASRPRCGR